MSCNCKPDCNNNIKKITNISKIWKGDFLKSAEVSFFVKSKRVSNLEVKQFTNELFGKLCEQLFLIIEVCNSGPDIESQGKLVDLLTSECKLDIRTVNLTKGTYTLDNGILIWDIGEIAPDEHVFAIISITPEKEGLYKSIATVYGNNCDPNLSNNFSVEKIPVIDCDLQIKLIIAISILIIVLILIIAACKIHGDKQGRLTNYENKCDSKFIE